MTSSSDIFGSHVLDLELMKKKLPKQTFHALKDAIEKRSKLGLTDADTIAHTIMEWALSKGVTHYTHWFQPMTGLTAQKHDAFFSFDSDMRPIERFSGSQLIQSEPDASSFPSGGMRTTFEARGYTAWDPSSPVFIFMNGEVPVLCIPSVFISYTGQALDKKTPLLRSIKVLDEAASEALKLLEGSETYVEATVGCEQEFFLVERAFFDRRPDLVMAGRTVQGCRPAKGQQMEDHYFGSIKDRVMAFAQDVEQRLYRLGVPCKTRHNEVAPHQFEMAPIFEPANLAADHNQLVMEVIKKAAKDHDMAALLHEKPFAEVNGSGKHLNWSMQTGDGRNLLEPGNQPHGNKLFLYFLTAVINAIHKRGDVLRSTIASAGNDHRLGANEAPPAIMSVFLGSHLTELLDKIESASQLSDQTVASIDLGLAELPHIMKDTTDRNRTSPFAFTGNKFEFRALGSNQSISMSAAVLNGAVAESIQEMNADLAKLDEVNEKELFQLLRRYIKRSKPVRFEGNNYSEAWEKEAEKRGLSNLKTTPEAYTVWDREEIRDFFISSGVLRADEIEARQMVSLEHYGKIINIEAGVLMRLIDNYILPPAFRYQTEIATSVDALKSAASHNSSEVLVGAAPFQVGYLENLTGGIVALLEARSALEKVLATVQDIEDEKEAAMVYAKQVRPCMDAARVQCDRLESLVDARQWGLPSYYELLFIM